MSNKVICDANTISSYIRTDKHFSPIAYDTINNIGLENVCITPVVYIELFRWLSLYKGFTTSERLKIKKFIDGLNILHINKNISLLSMDIARKRDHLPSPDVLIGATAVYYNIPLFTFNTKDFKQIKGIKLV